MGLTVGALFFPGFANYEELKDDESATTVSNVDLVNYILGNFKTVDEVRQAMPKIRVVRNAEIEKEFGTPLPLHHIVSDATGASIVIEYVDGKLSVTDNKVGAMTNSPRLRLASPELEELCEPDASRRARPHATSMGVSLAPFGAGSGMLGLPGDFTPPSRFVSAVAFVNTMDPGQGRGGRGQRRLGDAEQLRHPEGAGARRRDLRTSTSATPNGRSSPT